MTPEQHADAILLAAKMPPYTDARYWDRPVLTAILAAVTAAMEDGQANATAHALAYDVVCEQRDALRAQLAKVEAERDRLQKLSIPDWFYPDGYESETCHDSVGDVVEGYDLKPGRPIVRVDCATALPSIWCIVHVRTDTEMGEAESDDREVITEYATEDAARDALKETDHGD